MMPRQAFDTPRTWTQHAPLHLSAMLSHRRIQFCRSCGTHVRYFVPQDDNRERASCPACGTVHYENPLAVVGTLPVWMSQVLLCRRNIEPRFGLWTLPGGFLELGETTEQGALRETTEEAGAQIELQGLYTVLNVVHVGQVHLYYRARMLGPHLDPGPETIEAKLFDEQDIPWDELAFETVRTTLRCFFQDRQSSHFPVRCADIASGFTDSP